MENLRLLNRDTLEDIISSIDGPIRILDGKSSPILEVTKKENYTYTLDITLANETRNRAKLTQALRMSGAAEFQLTWMEGGRPHGISVDPSRTDFGGSFSSLVEDKRIVPDTNVLMNCSLSGICERIGTNMISGKTIGISRFSILELERKAAQSGNAQDDEEKLVQKKPVQLAMSEISYLLKSGGTMLPELEIDEMTGFSNNSGKGLMDSWIRREARKYFLKMAIDEERSYPEVKTRLRRKKGTFLTSDLISAMAANAEDIDTIHLSYLDDRQVGGVMTSISLKQLARLIIGVAIMFDTIVARSGRDEKFVGFWVGKTHDDWFNDRICKAT